MLRPNQVPAVPMRLLAVRRCTAPEGTAQLRRSVAYTYSGYVIPQPPSFELDPRGYFIHIFITTPVVSAWKNHYTCSLRQKLIFRQELTK